jgi:hypothetical protein
MLHDTDKSILETALTCGTEPREEWLQSLSTKAEPISELSGSSKKG